MPDNFIPRPQALDTVKAKLLGDDDKTLIISAIRQDSVAIAGLGGIGKSVLANALVLDEQVRERFEDGILWVTLGQNPDLLPLLGDWIRELDQSREAFSANTLESAARYLGTLLAERRMLLVVDDVWNAAHADCFRVGGVGCRVLVTTREARLEGAEYYDLDLMTEDEAISLVRQKLKSQWQPEQEAEVKAFAKVLGYLPLALDLAANQLRDRLSWAELRSEFESERRSVFLGTGRRSSALQLLDSSEAWKRLGEEEQRKYSLQACFNLSLKRLNPQQFEQFAWLGVLPEDVNLDRRVAAVLWDLSPLRAQKVLIDLRNRSFLTGGVDTREGEPSYRVHDLMHDLARISIHCPPSSGANQLGGLGMSLPAAHRALLERYRAQAQDNRWDKLPSDGYIHRRLTWHMKQAGWLDEIHALMAMSDERENNAWFEACDRIGQPAIFVEDVARAWEVAEQMYESEPTRSIVLQCRYGLITATLNSLVANLPIGMMAEFVKQGFWAVEQAWAYVEQMQEEENVAEAIQALAPYLSKSLFAIAVNKVRGFEYVYRRVQALKSLAVIGREYFPALLTAACEIQGEYNRADVLSSLAAIDRKYLPEALDTARQIQGEYNRAKILTNLAEIEREYFLEALTAARQIQGEYNRADILSNLAAIKQKYLPEALDAARQISPPKRADILSRLAAIDRKYFPEALDAACYNMFGFKTEQAKVFKSLAAIDREYLPELLTVACNIKNQNQLVLVNISSGLSASDCEYFPKILTAARQIQDEYNRAKILTNLAAIERKYLPEALDTTRQIQDDYNRAKVLANLATIELEYFPEALAAACQIQHEHERADILSRLATIEQKYFEVLTAARQIQDEYNRAKVLANLAAIDREYFPEALDTTRQIQSEKERAEVLSSLAAIDREYFPEALAAACQIRDEYNRAEILSNLAAIDRKYFPEILTAVCQIQYNYYWAIVWSNLAAIDREYFPEVLTVARQIQDKYNRADILSRLATIERAYLPEALAAARQIQHEHERAKVLSSLATIERAYLPEALTAARQVQHEYSRINVLISLVAIDGAYFSEALTAVREIQSEDYRAGFLSSLAKHAPEDCLIQIWESIEEITHKPTQAVALSGYSSSFSLTRLSHTEWCKYLHILTHRKRAELMEDLVRLYPAILHLGGATAMRGVVDAMNELCSQWR